MTTIIITAIIITVVISNFVAQKAIFGRFEGPILYLIIREHKEKREAKKAREQRRYERLKRRLES